MFGLLLMLIGSALSAAHEIVEGSVWACLDAERRHNKLLRALREGDVEAEYGERTLRVTLRPPGGAREHQLLVAELLGLPHGRVRVELAQVDLHV